MVVKTWNKINDLVKAMEGDINKVENSKVKASAKRARKAAQEIKGLCHQLRKELLEETN